MDPSVQKALEDAEKLNRQKAVIRYLESSNGQNMNHDMLTSGPNKGQTAGGAYGIVPNSLRDFAKQSMNRNIGVDPDILVEMDKPGDEVTKQLNTRRDLDEKAAEMALRLINSKTGGDEAKSAYAWRTGHNKSQEEMEKGAAEHPYVQAYRRQYDKQFGSQKQDRKVAAQPVDESENIKRLLKLLGN